MQEAPKNDVDTTKPASGNSGNSNAGSQQGNGGNTSNTGNGGYEPIDEPNGD